MRSARLPGLWFYEKAITDCLCTIVTAGRNPLAIGEELYCEAHQRVALVTRTMPAQETEADELVEMDMDVETTRKNSTLSG